ncbi:MAG TPA: right-handed parallel beta-helix repeat-containing protein [Thermoanaerobaculia bacterium]|nr:right-handed parallel beta-helix repeat-containing protein [Thermoanaerobaculia bacterium]
MSDNGNGGSVQLSRQQRRALARARKKAEGGGASQTGKILASGAALTLGMGFGLGAPAEAATFTVTNLNDSGAGSLRQAISDANNAGGLDAVVFQAGVTGTITLTTGELYVSDSVNIQGPGQAVVTVNANHASRVFYVYYSDGLIDVTISGLTLTGGTDSQGGGILDLGENLTLDHVTVDTNTSTGQGGGLWLNGDSNSLTITNSVFSGNTAAEGGGIFLYDSGQPVLIQDTVISGNQSTGAGGGIYLYNPGYSVTIERSTLSGNQASGDGGGLFVYHTHGATVTLRQSTLSGNSASSGGGAYFYTPNNPVVVENSTISGNQVTGDGGGIFFYGSLYTGSDIRSATIANNSAGGSGGGVYLERGSLPMENTIVAGNTAATDNDISGDSNFILDHDLIQDPGGAGFTDNGGNIFNQSPQLSALGNHGGPTQTMLPVGTSPATDNGSAAAPPVDQRGVARPVGAGYDIGAVEVNPGTVQLAMSTASVNESTATITITATRTGGSDNAVSVSYATANGTAMAPGDYLSASGTLNWADQDTANKTFQVTIVNDAVPESNETFLVTLSNPQGGAVLGSPATETVTIIDDDVLPVTEVPTLGDAGKLLLAGLMGASGLLFLRRRRKLAAPVVAITLSLATAGGVDAAARPHGTREIEAALVSQVRVAGVMATLQLSDGTTIAVPLGEVQVSDQRQSGRGARVPLATVHADQPALVKVKHNADGSVKRVRITIFDSLAAAQARLQRLQNTHPHR